MVLHAFDRPQIGQPEAMGTIFGQRTPSLGDQQVHQLERGGTRWVLDVKAPSILDRKHRRGVVICPVLDHLERLCHKTDFMLRYSVLSTRAYRPQTRLLRPQTRLFKA